jgi:hypothetical protein
VFALLLPGIPPFFKTCLYCVGLYTMLGVVMDGPAALLLRPLRLSLAPHFLPPWDAPSLAGAAAGNTCYLFSGCSAFVGLAVLLWLKCIPACSGGMCRLHHPRCQVPAGPIA